MSRDATGEMLAVERQRADCEALATRLGWRVGGVYVDDDVSAFAARRRPGYEQLLADVTARRLDAVIAWHPDRLHRNAKEIEAFIDLINAAGARVATVQAGEYDLSSAAGRMTARVIGAVARHESEQKSERLLRQRVQAAKAGLPNGGPRPFGYEPGGLSVRDSEATVMREAAQRVLDGDSLRSVALDLNRRDIPTTFGNRWTVTSLRLMLLRPRYAALREHHGAVIGDAAWPAIISRDQHEHLKRHLARERRATPHNRTLLGGLARCGNCDRPLGHQPRTTNHARYYCLPQPTSNGGCGRLAVTAEPLEDHVTHALFDRMDTAFLAEAVRALRGVTQLDDNTLITHRLGALADLYADGAITKAEWLRARRRLEERLLGGPLKHPPEPELLQLGYAPPAGVLRLAWPTLATEPRRAILRAAIETITIAAAPKAGGQFNPARITIRWR